MEQRKLQARRGVIKELVKTGFVSHFVFLFLPFYNHYQTLAFLKVKEAIKMIVIHSRSNKYVKHLLT